MATFLLLCRGRNAYRRIATRHFVSRLSLEKAVKESFLSNLGVRITLKGIIEFMLHCVDDKLAAFTEIRDF